jgi:hypothetical protein
MKPKSKEAERRRIPVGANSPYTSAHKVLLNAQNRNGNNLHLRQVREQLENTPEIVFPPGTTLDKVLKNLERWDLLKFEEGGCVRVVAKG